jgi:hypothetical protein
MSNLNNACCGNMQGPGSSSGLQANGTHSSADDSQPRAAQEGPGSTALCQFGGIAALLDAMAQAPCEASRLEVLAPLIHFSTPDGGWV